MNPISEVMRAWMSQMGVGGQIVAGVLVACVLWLLRNRWLNDATRFTKPRV